MRFRSSLAAVAVAACTSVLVPPVRADTVVTRETTVRTLAPGVHTIRHPDPTDDFPDGNTTVVIGSREVLVVDTGYLPSTARADIERIRAWTDKPVRWVVNTHWHNDHVGGNHAYVQAYPGAAVVAHPQTREMVERRIAGYLRRFADPKTPLGGQRERWRASLASGVDDQGQPLDAAARSALAAKLVKADRAADEFRTMTVLAPTLAVERSMRIDLGGRVVELRHLGRGNTGGDLVVWLPAERIVVAGDLVTHPVPYAFGGYPTEWMTTLAALAALDFETLVPGHGEVQRGRAYVDRVAALIATLRTQVQAQVDEHGSAATLESVQRAIALADARCAFAGDDAENGEFFDASIAGLIRLLYNEARAR